MDSPEHREKLSMEILSSLVSHRDRERERQDG